MIELSPLSMTSQQNRVSVCWVQVLRRLELRNQNSQQNSSEPELRPIQTRTILSKGRILHHEVVYLLADLVDLRWELNHGSSLVLQLMIALVTILMEMVWKQFPTNQFCLHDYSYDWIWKMTVEQWFCRSVQILTSSLEDLTTDLENPTGL